MNKPEISRFTQVMLGAIAVQTALLLWVPRVFALPGIRSHYGYAPKHLFASVTALLPLAAALIVVGLTVAACVRNRRGSVALLMLSFVMLQWSLAWTENGSGERISETLFGERFGHAEFVSLATTKGDAFAVAGDYENLRAGDPEFVFARAKPPGHLLVYSLAYELYEGIGAQPAAARAGRAVGFIERDPLTDFGAFLVVVFLGLSTLAVPVIVAAGRVVGGERTGLYAGLVFVLMPCTTLITMHLDQVLYPLLAAAVLLFALLTVRRTWRYGAALGAVLSVAVYVSLSLATLVPLGGLVFVAALLGPDERGRVWRGCGAALAASLATLLFLHFTLGFEPLFAGRAIMQYHTEWRGTEGLMGPAITLRNAIEWARWLGLPTALLLAAAWWRAMRRDNGPEGAGLTRVMILGFPLVMLAISTFGGTRDEIGRLWLPLIVPVLPIAALELEHHYAERPALWVGAAVWVILLTKSFTDFA